MFNRLRQISNRDSEYFNFPLSEQSQDFDNDYEVKLASKILFVIVLYKTKLTNSLTFQSLEAAVKAFLPHDKVELLVCDNSPTPQFDVNETTNNNSFNFYYLYDSSNPGISLSYNKAAELAFLKGKNWIFVLDQDTILPIDVLKKYTSALRTWPNFPIYTPRVYHDNILLSPCKYFMHRGSPFTKINPGVHLLKNKNVINSGLLIDVEAYREVGGYDENVWLYFSDFVFFDRLKKYYKNFVVVDCSLAHELSSSDYSDLSFAINRFTYYCQGAKSASISSGSMDAHLGYGITVGLRSFLMCRRFRTIDFFKVYLNYYLLSK